MRRLLSIALLLLFGLPAVAPLFALGESAESRLPVCCRKGGMHHCMSAEQAEAMVNGQRWAAVQMKCPLYPKVVSPGHPDTLALHAMGLGFAEMMSYPAATRQAEAWARVAMAGARQKRGPPVVVLSQI